MNQMKWQSRVIELMSRFVAQIKGSAAMQWTDINKVAESALIPILAEVYGYRNLRNLNVTESANYPSVDLGDNVKRVAIQVTSTSTNKKVKETLQGFASNQLYEQYDRIIVYILTEKQKVYNAEVFDKVIGGRFAFDAKKDILDSNDLIRDINNSPTDVLQQVLRILEANFGEERAGVGLSPGRVHSNLVVVRYIANDRDFGIWLSLQLISNGYAVWCEAFGVQPGEITQAVIEELIRERAERYVFVLSSGSNASTDLLRELRFAFEISHSRQLNGFVVPVQLTTISERDKSILLHDIAAVDFSRGWSEGLHTLLTSFEQSDVKRDEESTPSKANEYWRRQFEGERGISDKPEDLLSNWFSIALPETIYVHELQRNGMGILSIDLEKLPYSGLQFGNRLISFATESDLAGKLGEDIFIRSSVELSRDDFLAGNVDQRVVRTDRAWSQIIELINNAWDRYASSMRLRKYMLANRTACYYFPVGYSANRDSKTFFRGIAGKRTWRSLAGKHKEFFWHFGIQCRALLHPHPVLVVKTHGLASNDGVNVWESKDRLHIARRSWFKNWWNSEWRDRLLAAVSFLSGESEGFDMPVANGVFTRVSATPISFHSPVSYSHPKDSALYADIDETLSNDDELDEIFEEYEDGDT